jgi:triosephosphate isomerase
MHKTRLEAAEFVRELIRLAPGRSLPEVVIIPSFVALAKVAQLLELTDFKLGAQDLFWEDAGAYTGEVSPLMLKEAGCQFVIIGHSERRKYFGETDELIAKKLAAALKAELIPILCIGENEGQREQGVTLSILRAQLTACLKEISLNAASQLVLAYEPIWAIGTGKTASPDQAEEAQEFIRRLLEELWGEELAKGIRVLYGGSVTPDNMADIMRMPNVDGALVGGASLKPDSFAKIINYEPAQK